jgi:hypothetical protein
VGPPGGTSTQLGKLSRRQREEDEVMDQANYLHPKKPSARMSIPIHYNLIIAIE